MPKSAIATIRRVKRTCPKCGSTGPHELIEGDKKTPWGCIIASIVLAPFTLFISLVGLLFAPFVSKPSLRAYCEACGEDFNP